MKKTNKKAGRPSEKEMATHRKEEAGVEPEFRYDPDRMVPVSRSQRHDAKPRDTDLQNVKVTISIRLDADIIEFFKRRAATPGSAPYQTQINNALRSLMTTEPPMSDQADRWDMQASKLIAEVDKSREVLGRDARKFEDVYARKLNDAMLYRTMAERLREQRSK